MYTTQIKMSNLKSAMRRLWALEMKNVIILDTAAGYIYHGFRPSTYIEKCVSPITQRNIDEGRTVFLVMSVIANRQNCNYNGMSRAGKEGKKYSTVGYGMALTFAKMMTTYIINRQFGGGIPYSHYALVVRNNFQTPDDRDKFKYSTKMRRHGLEGNHMSAEMIRRACTMNNFHKRHGCGRTGVHYYRKSSNATCQHALICEDMRHDVAVEGDNWAALVQNVIVHIPDSAIPKEAGRQNIVLEALGYTADMIAQGIRFFTLIAKHRFRFQEYRTQENLQLQPTHIQSQRQTVERVDTNMKLVNQTRRNQTMSQTTRHNQSTVTHRERVHVKKNENRTTIHQKRIIDCGDAPRGVWGVCKTECLINEFPIHLAELQCESTGATCCALQPSTVAWINVLKTSSSKLDESLKRIEDSNAIKVQTCVRSNSTQKLIVNLCNLTLV